MLVLIEGSVLWGQCQLPCWGGITSAWGLRGHTGNEGGDGGDGAPEVGEAALQCSHWLCQLL